MNISNVKMSQVASENTLRLDSKYHCFFEKNGWCIFNTNPKRIVSLGNILVEDYNIFEMNEEEVYKGIPTGQKYVNEFGFIDSYEEITIDNCPNRIKYKVSDENILISSLRLARSAAFIPEDIDYDKYIFSNAFYIFKVAEGWNKKYMMYVLRNNRIKTLLDEKIYRGIGISSYQVKDLLSIRIKEISLVEQQKIVAKIEPLEQKIKELYFSIKPIQETIDEVFGNRFNYHYDTFRKLTNEKLYIGKLSDFSNNVDLRCSVKFHRRSGEFVESQLKINSIRTKDALSVMTMTGKGITPKDYEDDTDCFYLSMGDISSWHIDYENIRCVSEDYEEKNSSKKPIGAKRPISTKVQKGDIVMMRSGEGGIGKVALVDQDINAIFSDFIIRFRFKKDMYLPEFCYYYMRSTYYQYLVEIYKKGLGNNTNIFPNIVDEFPIPKLSIKEQMEIINQINDFKFEESKKKDKILELQNEIEIIMNESLYGSD